MKWLGMNMSQPLTPYSITSVLSLWRDGHLHNYHSFFVSIRTFLEDVTQLSPKYKWVAKHMPTDKDTPNSGIAEEQLCTLIQKCYTSALHLVFIQHRTQMFIPKALVWGRKRAKVTIFKSLGTFLKCQKYFK